MKDTYINQMNLPPNLISQNIAVRWLLLLLGWFMIVLGVIGILVPGMPTTVFLIAAVWAFSRSSMRFQRWLWLHPKLGPPVRNWYSYRVIPIKAKILALVMMSMSFGLMVYVSRDDIMMPLLLGCVLVPVGFYICTRASHAPLETPTYENGAE